MKLHSKHPTKQLLLLFLLIPGLLVLLAVASQPQRFQQFAQEIFNAPPLFGCLQVGEGNPGTCASKLGKVTSRYLSLHGREITKNNPTVYYGDRIVGEFEYSNVGNLPIQVTNIGFVAQPDNKKNFIRQFLPNAGQVTIEPGKKVQFEYTSYKFKAPDPNGPWKISIGITDPQGQTTQTDDIMTKITVNATCTALRINELTENDKKNLQSFCSKNTTSELCKSREYCEIFKGEGCTQPNITKETPGVQCDNNVILPAHEQDLLEELCKVYPDTDACKDFCDRTAGSTICPKKYIVYDTSTGKPVLRIKHPKALYIHTLKDFPIKYSQYYPAKFPKYDPSKPTKNAPPKVLGATTTKKAVLQAKVAPNQIPAQAQGPTAPEPALPSSPARTDTGFWSTIGNAIAHPINTVGAIGQGLAQTFAGATPCQQNVNEQQRTGQCTPVGAPAAAPDPKAAAPVQPSGPAKCNLADATGCKPEVSTLRTGPNGTFVNAKGETVQLPAGLRYVPNAPANGGQGDPGTIFPCMDPPPGQPVGADLPLCTNPLKADPFDIGFDPKCASGRRDVDPNDDPLGAPQHACCLDAIKYFPQGGFCGTKSGSWVEPIVHNDGTTECRNKARDKIGNCEFQDYFGKACQNQSYYNNPTDPSSGVSPDFQVCKGADRDPHSGAVREPSFNNIIKPFMSQQFCSKPYQVPKDPANPQNGCVDGTTDGNGYERNASGDAECQKNGKSNNYSVKFPNGNTTCVNPNPKTACGANFLADANQGDKCVPYCPLGQLPNTDPGLNPVCKASNGDWNGFNLAAPADPAAVPGYDTRKTDCENDTNGGRKHLIILPDGKTPMCVFDTNPCPDASQYKDAKPGPGAPAPTCQNYCPTGQIPVDGTCKEAAKTGTPPDTAPPGGAVPQPGQPEEIPVLEQQGSACSPVMQNYCKNTFQNDGVERIKQCLRQTAGCTI